MWFIVEGLVVKQNGSVTSPKDEYRLTDDFSTILYAQGLSMWPAIGPVMLVGQTIKENVTKDEIVQLLMMCWWLGPAGLYLYIVISSHTG